MSDATWKIKFIYTEKTIEGITVRTLIHAKTGKAVYKKINHDPWIKV